MPTYDVPSVGTVIVTIDSQGFFQPGYELKSLGRVVRTDGAEVSRTDRARVEGYLRDIGVLT